jgi:hypothetical protein
MIISAQQAQNEYANHSLEVSWLFFSGTNANPYQTLLGAEFNNGKTTWFYQQTTSDHNGSLSREGQAGGGELPYANALKKHYENGNGSEYVLSENQLYYLFNVAMSNGAINWNSIKQVNMYSYTVSVNFYETNLDLALAFGRATMTIYVNIDEGKIFPIGFDDTWNLDSKDWGVRPYAPEVITRFFNTILDGKDFSITYP